MRVSSVLIPLGLMAWITTLPGCASAVPNNSQLVEPHNSEQPVSRSVEHPIHDAEPASEEPVDQNMRLMADVYGTVENFEVARNATTGWMSVRDADGQWSSFAEMPSSASAAVRSLLTNPRYFTKSPQRPRFFMAEVRYRFRRDAHTVEVHVNRPTRTIEVHVHAEVVGGGVLGRHVKSQIDIVLGADEL
jgi:hypothetical protein